MVDPGVYNKDPAEYARLIEELYARHPDGLHLPPEYAAFVENGMMNFLVRLARYKFAARMMRRTDRVLEVGCGSGLGSVFMSQHCAHVTGIDVKTTEIDEARAYARRTNVDFRVADLFDATDLGDFDVVVNLDVIEHMPIEQGRDLVRGLAARLKPDGMLVLGTPSFASWPHQSALSKASHVKCYEQEELVALIDECFGRTLAFSMNDEVVHTGNPKMAWYYFVIGVLPKNA